MMEFSTEFEIKVEIAFKSKSTKLQLSVISGEKRSTYDNLSIEEIPPILSIIGATIGIGFDNELLFHSMNAEMLNIKPPLQIQKEEIDTNYLVEKCKILKSLIISHSHLQTLALLRINDDKWKFFLPIDAKQTSFQAFRHLDYLTSMIKDADLIVGNLNRTESLENGFLFLIKNSKVKAVCLDDFDLILLKEKFINNPEEVLSILSPNNMNNSFHRLRAQSSEIVIKSIELDLYENLNIHEYGLESFEEDLNKELMNAIELACDLRSNKDVNFISTIAKFAMQENEGMMKILLKAGYSLTDHNIIEGVLSEKSKKTLINCVEGFLENHNPLSLKINIAIQLINETIEAQEKDLLKYEKISQVIGDILSHPNCSDELKSNIEAYNNMKLMLHCNEIILVLENYENQTDQFFHTKMLHLVLIGKGCNYLNDILKKYINRIFLNESIYGTAKSIFLEHLENKHYNRLIFKLSECSYGVKYFILHKGLENYCASNNRITSILSLLDQLSNSKCFNETHWQDIWKNNRFIYIMRCMTVSDDSRVIYKLINMGCQNKVPNYIPQDIAQKIDKLREQETDFVLPDKIINFEEFSKIIREMQTRNRLPENFRQVLTESIEQNELLYRKLDELGILEIFKQPIEKKIIIKAVNIIKNLQNLDDCETHQEFIDSKLSIITFNQKSHPEKHCVIQNKLIKIHQNFVNVYGNSFSLINYEKFVNLNAILDQPLLEPKNLQQSVNKILPYIIQKMKMWGCNATTADNISSLITIEPESKTDDFMSSAFNSPRFGIKTTQTSSVISKIEEEKRTPLSRLDIISGMMNTMDAIVSQEILNIMAKFPIALPLIIRELYDKDSYRSLMPWLTQPTIKWESSPGKIIENNLFVDKFKMIVTLRIGKTSEGRSGKSTILNQLLSAKHVFSCCGEPGAKRGKPVTLDGSVEFIWLTQETASPKLWESVLKKHYESGVNEIILLANLHGNPLEFENHLKIFKTIASSYIFFIMPENNENLEYYWGKLKDMLEIGEEETKIFYVAVDPTHDVNEMFPEELIIDTSRITDDSFIEKLRNVLKNCLKNSGKEIDMKTLQSFGKTKVSELIQTKESRNLIEFIEENTCKYVKKIMSLQRGNKSHKQCIKVWSENDKLDLVIKLMGEVLLLNSESRLKAMIHIEKQLNRISAHESASARQHFNMCLDHLQKTIGASGNDLILVGQLKEKVKNALNDINNISLGLEHFYREIGKLYEIILASNPLHNPYANLAKRYAELFAEGQAIELLDGDSGEIIGPWLSAIFENVYRQFPGMRIFVISILGLQSSGKSTLLNALFACKFAVSVGRCTKGLFMRLLFLDDIMKSKLKFDAILLIDTEGLGAPEKQNEADAERKDRIMATFAMGISHLTIVNVLGEYMRDLTEILQIAIVAMARLEKADISPDILMVQHLTERNSDKMTNASKQFGDALEKAIEISDEKDVDLGIRDSKCLNTLRHTISTGNLFRQFRPFKNGASVYSPPSDEYHQDVEELYKFIIDIAEKSSNKADFRNWQLLIHSYWDGIKEENLMRFKDVKDLQEHCKRSEIMAKVKESIESVFREHSEIIKIFITEQAKKLNKQEVTRDDVLKDLKEKLRTIPSNCPSNPTCEECKECRRKQSKLYEFVAEKPSEHDTKLTVFKFINKTRYWHLNQLSQMMDAIAIRQIESAETLDKIEKRLKDLLRDRENFSESEILTLTNNIWQDIEAEAKGRVTQVSIKNQILDEIPLVYQERPDIITNLSDDSVQNFSTIPAIHNNIIQKGVKFVTGDTDLLEHNQAYYLEHKIIGLSDILLKEDNAKNYQTGMVAKLKRSVEQIIKDFESTNKLKLKSDFKWTLHSFANRIFHQNMSEKQKQWDAENNPLTILRNNKSSYIEVITERLRYGFTYDSEGLISGKRLLVAIKQKSMKVVNEICIYDALSIDWLSNSESVRLKYFSELVEQVKHNHFKQALKHFKDPKMQIETWFIKNVNNLSEKGAKLEDIFKLELNRVKQAVKNGSTINEIRSNVEEYLSSDDMDMNKNLDPSKANKTEIKIFKDRILEVLNDDKKLTDLISKTQLINPSSDKRVIYRMGCTFACPFCSALCWGHRGHHKEEGESSKHHTCHQPMGLSGVHSYKSKKLICQSCHNQKEDDLWREDGKWIPWSAKKTLDRFKNWKYETHVIKIFNDLMKWFFFKLNDDIAKIKKYCPPNNEEKNKHAIYEHDIGTIMAVINGRI